MRTLFTAVFCTLAFGLWAQESDAPPTTWPQEITTKNGVATVYQPQLEELNGNTLSGRAAISYKAEGSTDLDFGAFWFESTLDVNKEERIAIIQDVRVIQLNFPAIEDEERLEKARSGLEAEMNGWDIITSYDLLLGSLADADQEVVMESQLNNDSPEIYFRNEPAVLVSIDGEPVVKDTDDKKLSYVANSPFFLVRDNKAQNFYLKGGEYWYTTKDPTGDWDATSNIPRDIASFEEKNRPEASGTDSAAAAMDGPPAIIVTTTPSELILIDGEPDYGSLEGTQLLFVKNTESDVIVEIGSQKYFVLLAGRWYSSTSLKDGEWDFVDPVNLPEDFAKISAESEMAHVLISVPGTPQAQDALLSQSIPETAAVNRKETKVDVNFDGDPKFEKVDNTEVAYALNSDKTILRIRNKYYCVDNGIWFVSSAPSGPYEVSDTRPDEVDDLPPDSPVYNTKYVYIYDSTPEVVYVGYTPGYMYSYSYGGVVVYGTGYHYPYWYGSVYYPRPVTFGWGVHYNPWTGWGFSIGFSYGWVGWGYHPYYRPYWGPAGYHAGYRHGYHHGYNNGYRHGYHNGYRAGYAAAKRDNARRNVYNSNRAGVKPTSRPTTASRPSMKARPSNRQNNVYTDRSGNVYQRNNNGHWNQKTNGSTRPANRPSTQPSTRPGSRPSTQPSTRPGTQPSTRPSTNQYNRQEQLNRSYQNRQRSQNNYNQYQRSGSGGGYSRPNGGGARPAGRPAGGGGRRR